MTDARKRLEELGVALTKAGFTTRLAVADPPLLQVENARPPVLREQIGCRVNPFDGELWFEWSAQQVFLARSADVPSAVERVKFVLQLRAKDMGAE